MCHEVWIGVERGASARHRAIGFVQRQFVLEVLRTLSPVVVTTTNGAYARLLKRRGVPADRLSLFGNIAPLTDQSDEVTGWVNEALSVELGLSSADQLGDYWFFVHFGSLHGAWQPEALFEYVREAAQRAEKRPCFVSIGRMGAGEARWSSWRREYGAELGFFSLSGQPEERISALLRCAHFGVASSPWLLIGKSSAAQAMLDHGLPVIVSRDDLRYRDDAAVEEDRPDGLIKMDESLPERLLAARRGPVSWTLPRVADEFLSQLGRS
jgi:hypothetical protein